MIRANAQQGEGGVPDLGQRRFFHPVATLLAFPR
jgi:hypothetical protein